MNDLTHISLFTGIGGFDLAASWAGFRTIAMCEIDPFCQEVLKARFGAVADAQGEQAQPAEPGGLHAELGGAGGVRTTGDTEGDLPDSERQIPSGENAIAGRSDRSPLLIPDIRDFDGTRFRGATLLTGGFPCQPFSNAGKKRGKRDERFLWREMLRVISEARPTWCIAENVDGLSQMVHFDIELPMDRRKYTQDEMATGPESVGELRERIGRGILDEVLEDLEKIGYEVAPVIVPAAAVSAPHLRYRIWICARRIDKDPVHGRGRVGASQEQGRERNERDAITGDGERLHSEPSRPAPQDPLLGGNGGRGDGDTPRLRRALQTARPDSDADHPECSGCSECSGGATPEPYSNRSQDGLPRPADSDAPDADRDGPQEPRSEQQADRGGQPDEDSAYAAGRESGEPQAGNRREDSGRASWDIPWIEVASALCDVAYGLPSELDRFKPREDKRTSKNPYAYWRTKSLQAGGNAIVPQVAYPIIKAIAEIELGQA